MTGLGLACLACRSVERWPRFLPPMKIYLLGSLLLSVELLSGAPPELIGPFGGSAAVVQVDSTRPGTVLAATSNALLFRSSDGGNFWARVAFAPELRATLHAFVIAPRTGVYLAALASDNREYSGIFASGDGGQTWRSLIALEKVDVWSIAIWPVDPSVIAAGTADGVFLTRDGGEHWARISPESNRALKPVVSIEFDPADSRTLYVGTPHLPWKTSDGGVTWRPARAGMLEDSDVFSIHVDANHPTRVFASACSGMYRSLNQALSWTKLTGAREASYRTYQITQHPTQANVFFAGTAQGLIKSVDGGTSWRKLSSYATRWIAFDPARPYRVYTATDEAGLFRSDNFGESFRPINEGFCNLRVASFAALGETLYASSPPGRTGGGIFRNVDLGENWEKIEPAPPWRGQQILQVLPLDPSHLYVLTSKDLFVSSDVGRTWTILGLPGVLQLRTLLAPPAGGRKLLVGTDRGIYHTDNAGETWQLAHVIQGQPAIRSLISLGPRAVAAVAGSSVLVSSDGIEYRPVASLGLDSEIHALIATNHGDLLAATSKGLRRSEDDGASWLPVSGVLGDSTVSAICKHPVRPDVLFAARYGSIFTSMDNGRTWASITSEGEKLPAIRELVTTSGIPDTLFAVTPFQGVYAVPLEQTLTSTECQGHNCEVTRIQIQQSPSANEGPFRFGRPVKER